LSDSVFEDFEVARFQIPDWPPLLVLDHDIELYFSRTRPDDIFVLLVLLGCSRILSKNDYGKNTKYD